MLILGGFYALLRALSREGMGGGDVKLAALIGLVLGWHGWQALVVGAAAAFVLGAVHALGLIVLRRATVRRTSRSGRG
jgi:leader peptidase (prepilin peptidase)/N-methyltransferase